MQIINNNYAKWSVMNFCLGTKVPRRSAGVVRTGYVISSTRAQSAIKIDTPNQVHVTIELNCNGTTKPMAELQLAGPLHRYSYS